MSDYKEKPYLIKIHPEDNVKIVVNTNGIKAGTLISEGFRVKEDIPQGHKIALKNIKKGNKIIKYGKTIGYAQNDIRRGSWINENKVGLPDMPDLENISCGADIKDPSPLNNYTFTGYRNKDGTVGTKNMLGIVACVQCVEGVVNNVVDKIKKDILPQYPRVDGIISINHNYGCGVAIDAPDAEIPIKTIKNLADNPNLGKIIIVSLGCEKLPPDKLFPEDKDKDVIVFQQEKGYKKMEEKLIDRARYNLEILNNRKREVCPASKLVVGLQCGGSDAFSGITANPAVGYAADLLVRAGASVIFSEVSEVRDGIHMLASRVKNEKVLKKLKKVIKWYDNYLSSGQVDRDANPAPGNKQGGLANIVEKALGSIEKSGTTPIVDVLSPGEKVKSRGLIFAATPASDFVCGTLQLSAGINLQVFTTGRGTPYGLAMAPVIKVSSRTELKKQWEDLIDIDAGKIATGETTYKEVGKQIFEMILQVASGEKTTRADYWGIENRLCLFNPTIIT
ncbi:MAG: galactarate dehydratase [Halanaerobiaceae bacterium]